MIGIIAALTMPTLINKQRSYVLHKQFLRSYSNLCQSILFMKNDLGIEKLNKEYATYDYKLETYPDAPRFYQEFDKYLKVVDEVEQYSIKNYNATAEAGKNDVGGDNPKPLYILSDGSSVGRYINGSTINLYVDVNGPKKGPNRYGFDVFLFRINSVDAIVPVKMSRLYSDEELKHSKWPWLAGSPCSKKSNQPQNGIGCSYYALNNINPDVKSKKYWESLQW